VVVVVVVDSGVPPLLHVVVTCFCSLGSVVVVRFCTTDPLPQLVVVELLVEGGAGGGWTITAGGGTWTSAGGVVVVSFSVEIQPPSRTLTPPASASNLRFLAMLLVFIL